MELQVGVCSTKGLTFLKIVFFPLLLPSFGSTHVLLLATGSDIKEKLLHNCSILFSINYFPSMSVLSGKKFPLRD